MQLPDENIEFQFQRLLVPLAETWSPVAELQNQYLLPPEAVDRLKDEAIRIRGQVVAERELQNPPPKMRPLHAGFIDLPQKLLDGYKRKQDASDLGKILRLAQQLRDTVDRVVILGTGGNYLAPKALFDALCHSFHNEMPANLRMGRPRIYFEGHSADNDSLQELFELLENTCVDPDLVEERWGIIVISKSGETLETAAAFRALKAEAAKFYGPKSELLRRVIVPITGARTRLRDVCKMEGFTDDQILTIPDDVGGRFSVFTAAGLLPAAVMGLDVRAMLLGAATMTRRFIEEPFDRNPVLQLAAINHLMYERGKTVRVLAAWSKKLEAVGWWYDQLLAESLGKANRGATPLTVVCPRDLYGRGQQFQDGLRDKLITNLIVRQAKQPPVMIGMSDRNEDDLNQFSRKGLPDLLEAAYKGAMEGYWEVGRPTADIILPMITEHTIGQLLQLLMLATVVEGRLMGTNPYGQPGVQTYREKMLAHLKAVPNLPKGEMRDAAKGM
jgi:glucose-6-phosphate isomerase